MTITRHQKLSESAAWEGDDEMTETTCWTLKTKPRRFRLNLRRTNSAVSAKSEPVIFDAVDGVRYVQEQFDSRPVTPQQAFSEPKNFLFNRKKRNSIFARKTLFPQIKEK